jgi:outer membrane protein assembly factor BamE (lipoprotein component of BamABCDE complex)
MAIILKGVRAGLRNWARAASLLICAAALAACTTTYRNHGYVPSDDDLSEIAVGVDTQGSVEETVGRPTTSGVLQAQAWYYVGSRWRHFAFLAPMPVDRQVVAISFDGRGVVSNIERFTLEDGQVVPLSRRVTDSSVKNTTFLRQLMGNLGQFDAGQILN